MDPVTIGLIAAGAQAAGGALQSIFSGRKNREAQLEQYAKQSPLYTPSKSINDYYQQALNRYAENPYQSQQYQVGQRNIQRATAGALNNLQGWGAATAGASRLAQTQSDALNNLGSSAEAQRSQRLAQLGQAAGAQSAEQYKAFDINQMTPYNRQLQLKQMAAQAANERYNAGLQMVGGALGNAAQIGAMSGANKGFKTPQTTGISSADTFNTWMQNPSVAPQLDRSLMPGTSQLTGSGSKLFGASKYFPNSYTTEG